MKRHHLDVAAAAAAAALAARGARVAPEVDGGAGDAVEVRRVVAHRAVAGGF